MMKKNILKYIRRSCLAASLLFLVISATAQDVKKNIQLLHFTETISNLGAIAVDQNGEPLTPTKSFKYNLYFQIAKNKSIVIKSIHINNKKIFSKLETTFETSRCIGFNSNSNDSFFVKPTSKNQVIQAFEVNQFTNPKNKNLQKIVVGVSQHKKIRFYTFFVPKTILSPLVLFQ